MHSHYFDIVAEVKDPNGNQVHTETIKNVEGAIHFKSQKGQSGLFSICFSTSTSHWFGMAAKNVRVFASNILLLNVYVFIFFIASTGIPH